MGATASPNLPVKECGTPDTIWGADVSERFIRFDAFFPVPLVTALEREAFIAEMHAAMLPVVERLYARRWKQAFAGKRDIEGRLYPERYIDLWPRTGLVLAADMIKEIAVMHDQADANTKDASGK